MTSGEHGVSSWGSTVGEEPLNEHEPLTLDNTAPGLIAGLRYLVDEYGLAGVRSTLELMADESHDVEVVSDGPDGHSPDDMPPVVALGGAIGRHATVACRQGAHDLCRDADCGCRCHE